jgi:hypothetical protein
LFLLLLLVITEPHLPVHASQPQLLLTPLLLLLLAPPS